MSEREKESGLAGWRASGVRAGVASKRSESTKSSVTFHSRPSIRLIGLRLSNGRESRAAVDVASQCVCSLLRSAMVHILTEHGEAIIAEIVFC